MSAAVREKRPLMEEELELVGVQNFAREVRALDRSERADVAEKKAAAAAMKSDRCMTRALGSEIQDWEGEQVIDWLGTGRQKYRRGNDL